MAPYYSRHYRPPRHSYPNNKERMNRFSLPGNGHRTINRRRNNPEMRGITRNGGENIARGTPNSYLRNRFTSHRPCYPQYHHTENSHKTTNITYKRKLNSDLIHVTNHPNGPLIQGENMFGSPSNIENQRDAYPSNKRRKINDTNNFTNNNTVTNRQYNCVDNKTTLYNNDNGAASKERRYTLSSNYEVINTSNVAGENSSIPEKILKTSCGNQTKEESKRCKILKKCAVLPSVSEPTEANHIADTPKSLNKKNLNDQKNTSSLNTDKIKQFKILLCEISSKIKDGWQLDSTDLSVEDLGNGQINFTKGTGPNKLYSSYEAEYIISKKSEDTKLNYATFSQSHIKKYFQRYLNFCNNMPADFLQKFEVGCNIKLSTATFDKQGIGIVELEREENTYKLVSYKKDIKQLGLYKKYLICCKLPNLADLIIDCMNNGHAHFNNHLLKKYFLTFIKEKILEMKNEKEKYILTFHQDFIRGNNLAESAKELRRILSKRIKLAGGMEFTVSSIKFKEYKQESGEPLPVEKYDMFHKFLKIFRFKVVDNNIDAMVKSTIGEQFIAIDNDWCLNAVQVELYRILALENSNSQLFDILKREVHKCNVIKRLQEEPCFQQENIKFEDTGLQQIYQYLTDGNEKVVFCSTKHIAITEHKLRQLSNEIFGYTENEESLFIKDNVLFEMTEDVKQGFFSHSLKLLVILLQEQNTVNHTQLKKILNDICSRSFSHADKSIIVVFNTKSENSLRRLYPDTFTVKDDETSPLSPESLHQLQQSNVALHGHGMKIADLMDDAEIAELIKFPEILEQLLSEKLIFEDVLIKPNGFDLKCYDAELRDETNKICEVIDILKCNSQVAIISGESGIGKSFFLYQLAQKTCNEYASILDTHFWLIQINLNKLPFEEFISQDTMNILELFVRYLDLTDFHKKVFIMSAEGRLKIELILVIDGYDGLQSKHKNFALKVLNQFKNSSIKKMFIASRNDSIFESGSEVLRYTTEFSVENKKQYCCKYFAESADYVDSLAKELTSMPLHLKMLHEIISSHEQFVPINDLFDLYKKYVELKKINLDDIYFYFGLSAQRLLSKEDFQLLNFEFQEDFNFEKDLQHVTFYEYFTAWWLSGKFLDEENLRRNILIIADRLIGKTSPVFLCTFLAPIILIDLVDELAQHGLLNFLKVLLSFKDIKKPNIHSIIEKNNTNAYEVLKCLFEHYKRTNDCQLVEYVNQQVNNETPIQVSCRLRKVDIACELMLLGAEVRFLDQNFLIDMTMYVIRELMKGNSQFENIAEKLLELSPDVLTHSRQELGYPELMKYLFERGRKTMIELLLMRVPNRKELLTIRVDGKSPLDLVIKSKCLDNSQRLEMYKYIIENVGSKLERENKFFIEPVLRGACETDCDRTFNYFVDRYPGNVNGFLNTALRKNRLNDVEFVVKISKRKRTIDEEGNTLVHRAIKFRTSEDITDFLIAREGLKEVNTNKETPLHVAFKTGCKFPMIKYLIEKYSSTLFATDKYGLHPWCYAILDRSRAYDKTEQIELMDYLLNYKNIEPPGTSSFGSKSDAYKREVRKKLEYFRDPQSFMRQFSLLSSLRSGEEYFCRFMIVHGANVNVTGKDGKTPLHVALECKLYELAKLMLQHGAMFDVEDSNGVTPLQQLVNSSDRCNRMKDILELAREIFSDEKSLPNYLPVAEKYLKSSRMRHVVNCRDRRRRSLFHLAVVVGDEIVVRNVAALSKICCAELTDFPKLDVNDRDVDGHTPLELAASRGFHRVVDELRFLGARSG